MSIKIQEEDLENLKNVLRRRVFSPVGYPLAIKTIGKICRYKEKNIATRGGWPQRLAVGQIQGPVGWKRSASCWPAAGILEGAGDWPGAGDIGGVDPSQSGLA